MRLAQTELRLRQKESSGKAFVEQTVSLRSVDSSQSASKLIVCFTFTLLARCYEL